MDFRRNNLAESSSPYLRQHEANPVWWQEWTPEVLQHAVAEDKPLFVSVGYSTCHWCHVMAADAFSDEACARVLNEGFVAIKVDREQRPDIDQYLMSFLVATTGSGGWPLNAFLTPDGKPFFAMTYASSKPRYSMPAFSSILDQVLTFFNEKGDEIQSFDVPATRSPSAGTEGSEENDEFESVRRELIGTHDAEHGGFGTSQKFPPHSTLLFLLYACAALDETAAEPFRTIATSTLDVMMRRGLHDHLQGGFFRYCVDRNWTIPHFEKMLYDQAMMLWNYSLAARMLGSQGYRNTVSGIVTCLEETFRIGDVYAAAHDADTDHVEGMTYVWSMDELTEILDRPERDALFQVYGVSEEGNFEGKNHLVRSGDATLQNRGALIRAEAALLQKRRRRAQPFRDTKLLTGWNSLAGCGLVAAHRFAGISGALDRALEIARAIRSSMGADGIPHDLGNPEVDNRFLFDQAAFGLLVHFLAEHTNEFDELIPQIRDVVQSFRSQDAWFESHNADFRRMPADSFDSPTPSSSALADAVVLLNKIREHGDYDERDIPSPLAQGFAGVVSLLSRGYFHTIERPEPLEWDTLPANSVQIPGQQLVDCYRGVCYMNLDHLQADKKTGG